ncbi:MULTISPECIES: hypothetical protein [unclassified Sphingomonas]|uniref:hypothetical protein n=1 Tax=unclassified Sphingomonas TaxID=196159 RepID=UPI00215179BC|nr:MULTISPECIES: hypothetical protein [unclassified Sphingomonas]MCR5872380.1 hypothetical protein [Sphingomonas sp. J344]UUX99330.1 hypothetical protein LRS08_18030 [Sphingomonas sp. J315]
MRILVSGLIASLLPAMVSAQNNQTSAQGEIKALLERVRAPMYAASGATVPGKTATYSISGAGCSTRLEVSYPSHQIGTTSHPARADTTNFSWGQVRSTRLSNGDQYVVVVGPGLPERGRFLYAGTAAAALKAAIDRLVRACGGTTSTPVVAPPAPPSQPAIKIETVPGKGYAAVVDTFPVSQLTSVGDRISALAKQRCGRLSARMGRYKYFTSTDAQGRAALTQYRASFTCYDPATDPYERAPADWKPSAQDQADLTAFAERYMGLLDRADYVAGMPMMEPMLEIEKDEWLSVPNMLKQYAGGKGRWTLQTLGWVNNPEGASHPGRYAFVKVTGTYPKIATYCGTLVIYRQRPGSYLITQQNLGVIPESWITSGRTTRAEALKTCDH